MLIFMSLLLLGGCGKSTLDPDSYVEGTDYQYQFYNRQLFITEMAKGKEFSYMTIGHYIYQLDEKTQTVAPLCNKTNCLHDKETDDKRLEECNAYIDSPDGASGLAYMNGFVYFVDEDWSGQNITNRLWKCSKDGSTREKIYEWNKKVVEGVCFHRGSLYYVDHSYNESNEESYEIKQLKLDGIGKFEPKTIFKPDKNVAVYAYGELKAFGNHIYITVNGEQTDKTERLTDEEIEKMSAKEWNKYSYAKTFQYNLMDEELTEIKVPEQSDSERVSQITFWKNKIVFKAFDGNKSHDYDTETNVYIANLDGTDAKVLLENIPMYRWISSDGNYLYVSDCSENMDKVIAKSVSEKTSDEEKTYQFTTHVDVYDKNMKLVDSMVAPYKDLPTEPAYGIGNRMYIQTYNKTEDGMKIMYWDKSKIGTYHGKTYEFTEFYEQALSEKDMKEKEESGE